MAGQSKANTITQILHNPLFEGKIFIASNIPNFAPARVSVCSFFVCLEGKLIYRPLRSEERG
jgi:hypothetical protein